MNVYQVVSETLEYQEIIDLEIGGPWIQYCIAEMVAAPSVGRAKWLAFKSDIESQRGFAEMCNMPKFSVKMVRRNEDWPEGILPIGLFHLWTVRPKPYLLPEVALVEDYIAEEYAMLFDDYEPTPAGIY